MIKRLLFLCLLLFSHLSVSAGVTDLKLSTAQIFDVQWYISGGRLYASGFSYIYASVNYATQTTQAARWTLAQTQDANANGRYIGFFNSTTNPGTYGMAVFNSNGSIYKIINNTGSFAALADGAIFYNGNGMWGTLITTGQGYNNGQSGNWAVTQSNPTNTQLQAYTPPSSTPLAAGQTAQSSAPTVTSTVVTYTWRQTVTGNVTRLYRTKVTTTNYSDNTSNSSSDPETLYSTATSTVTEVSSSNTQSGVVTTTTTRTDTVMADNSQTTSYSSSSVTTPWPNYVTIGAGNVSNNIVFNTNSNITTPQQSKVDVWTNKTVTGGNSIYIDQVSGSDNTVTMEQDGNKNKITATLDGSTNAITVKQGTPGIGQNEIKLGVTGGDNTINISQARNIQGAVVGTNGHYHDATVNGTNNTLTTQQSNTGGVGGHYMETTINGNQNSVIKRQTDNANKIMFTTINGNNNTVEAVQKDGGQHYLDTKISGNNNSVNAIQEGTVANRATLDLTNSGGPASVILQQNGGQNVTVTTTCATAGGCAPITVRQGY